MMRPQVLALAQLLLLLLLLLLTSSYYELFFVVVAVHIPTTGVFVKKNHMCTKKVEKILCVLAPPTVLRSAPKCQGVD